MGRFRFFVLYQTKLYPLSRTNDVPVGAPPDISVVVPQQGRIHLVSTLDANKSPVGSNMYILYLNKYNIEFTKSIYVMD